MDKSRETKSLLAKLMAAENINVEYREKASTAAFDTKNRTLIMPVLKDISESATDLFLGHEVGHALYTPADGIDKLRDKDNIFFGVVNIVEDARIEKMIQNKFPGLRKSFYDGYTDLINKDFFSINGKDLSTYNLIDRLNIHFKGGVRAGVEFSDEEMVFVERMENLRTFEETMKLAEDLFDHSAENFTPPDMGGMGDEVGEPADNGDDGEPKKSGKMKSDGLTVKDEDGESGDDGDDGESSDGTGENEKEDKKNDSPGNADFDRDDSLDGDEESDTGKEETGGGHEGGRDGSDIENPENLESKTQNAFDKRVESYLDDSDTPHKYGKIPKVEVEKILVSMSDVHKAIDDHIEKHKEQYSIYEESLDKARISFGKFRSEQKSLISYLAKEFEMRKSADEHKRTKVARTGILNPNKLHAYKFSEDLFLRNNVVTDGKNHGFVMFVDWSGSMDPNMANTLDQLTLLALFCKKVNIPFDVFAFSDQYYDRDATLRSYSDSCRRFDKMEVGDIGILERFHLLHLVSSTVSTAKFNESMTYLRYLRESFAGGRYYTYSGYSVPVKLGTGGTPLNEAIISAMEIVPLFQKKNNVQIVNTIFLTDGAGGATRVLWDGENFSDHFNSGYEKSTIVDPVTKIHYNIEGYMDTPHFFHALKERTGVRIAGYYIAPARKRTFSNDCGWLFNDWEETDNHHKAMTKDSYVIVKNEEKLGYEELYILSNKKLAVDSEEDELDIDPNTMTQAKMKNAFIKNRKDKFISKTMLSKFAEFVS